MKERKKKITTEDGSILEVDTSKKACHPFGFYAEDTIKTPFGEAEVAGVFNNTLYYIYKGKQRANCWGSGYRKEGLMRVGFKLIKKGDK